MPAAAPSFLAFEDWKSMSEREQDALLDRLEAQSGPSLLGHRVLVGAGRMAVALAMVVALVLLSVAL